MTESKSSGSKMIMFLILLVSAICVSCSQLKVSALMAPTMELLNVDATQAAMLNSLFTVAGIVLSIPGAAIMGKTGSKNMLLILMGTLAVGNVIGAMTDDFTIMMASRIIEGISYALIITVGVSLINMWFTGSMVGTLTGVYNTFAAAANFITMNGALALYNSTGDIKIVWWVLAAASAVCFVLVFLVIKEPEQTVSAETGQIEKPSAAEALSDPALLITSVSMLCLAYVLFSIMTCYPQIFAYYGVDTTTANFYASLNGLFGIPVCVISGIICGKLGKPFHYAIIGAIGCALMCFAIPYLGPSTYVIHVLASAIFPGGMVMTAMFIFTPMLAKRPANIPMYMGVLNTLYYIGVFASTPLTTALSDGGTNWVTPSLLLTAASVVTLVCTFIGLRFYTARQKATA